MTSKKEGMQLLDQHLKDLVTQRTVTGEEAMRYASDPMAIVSLSKNLTPAAPVVGSTK
jgi:Tfp pilus assembly pilus retraction ATPase PilT